MSEAGPTPTSISGTIKFAFAPASRAERRRFGVLATVLSGAGILDVAGVVLLGLASSWLLAVGGGDDPPSITRELPLVSQLPQEGFGGPAVLLGLAVGLLVFRTILSLIGTRKLVDVSADVSADFAAGFWRRLLKSPSVMTAVTNSNHVAFSLTHAATGATSVVTTAAVLVLSDVILVVILSVTLLVLSPIAGLTAMAVFGGSAWLLVSVLSKRSHRAAEQVGLSNIRVDTQIHDGVFSYKEAAAIGGIMWMGDRFEPVRREQAHALASQSFIVLVPRYASELVLVLSIAVVGLGVFATASGVQAAALLVAYAAAASRIMPAVVRIQSSLVQIRAGSGQAAIMHDLLEQVRRAENLHVEEAASGPDASRRGLALSMDGVSYAYGDGEDVLTDVTVAVRPGEALAIVGPSGSGKSTLVNLVLGLLEPTSGCIRTLGDRPGFALQASGRIAYVSQDSWLLDGTLRDNLALGRSLSDGDLVDALHRVGLDSWYAGLPAGLDEHLNQRGGNLSGGQRQRVGIARALAGDPELLVLDEATSALDVQSESAITRLVSELHGTCSVVIVAHRLRTVLAADQVIYLDGGQVLASGTFNDVRLAVPDLEAQAGLSGILAAD